MNMDRELQMQLLDEEVGGARVSQSKSTIKDDIIRNSLTKVEPAPDEANLSQMEITQ